MSKQILITWHGKTQSLRSWSMELGVNYTTVIGRYRRGLHGPDELFSNNALRHFNSKRYTCGGKSLTRKEWAIDLGLSVFGIAYRLRRFPLEIALDPGSRKVVQRIEYAGNVLTIKEWANKLGLTHQRVRQRLERYPVHIALSGIKQIRRPSYTYTYGGKTRTLNEWANELGVAVPTLYHRLRTAGEKALDSNYRPKRGRPRTASSCVRELPPNIDTGSVLKVGDGFCVVEMTTVAPART